MRAKAALLICLSLAFCPATFGQGSFVHWENPQSHPLELTPDGARLLAVNTADARLEVYDATGPALVPLPAIPVGLNPVSVRARNELEAWVVDHLGDAVHVVDLPSGRVRATLATDDEPCDVVFAGVPQRAFVSCSQANTILVFDPVALDAAPLRVELEAEDPRALAVSPDGRTVYAAIFESGNGTTTVGGGSLIDGGFPPNAVSEPGGPHGGSNPPPNAGAAFDPPLDGALPTPPGVALIVRENDLGQWMDDSGGDWTEFVSGSQAGLSGRPVGWQLHDRDVAVIDVGSLAVSWVTRLMNLNMALAVHPVDGRITVSGTDATNEIRFEPNVRGTFLRVNLALVDPQSLTRSIVDLNPHLDYSQAQLPQSERDRSLGDPRAIVWNAAGTRAYVSGKGSNNIVVVDANGQRAGLTDTIEVGEGPTGLALDEASGRLYVLARFEAAVSVVDVATETEVSRVPFHDPTPASVAIGRRHLFSTHDTSGLGHIACASCHVDTRMDRLAWDLGDPSGSTTPTAGMNLAGDHPVLPSGFPTELHPMKGPMLTQTLQDIIGKEPLHWRGDRAGIEAFNGAFLSLQGDDQLLSAQEMQELEDYLASMHFPPNPFRTFENELPSSLALSGHYTTGRFAPAGQPLPSGDPGRGLELFRPPFLLDGGVACATCHTFPTGVGPDSTLVNFVWEPIAAGPDGERHHMLTLDGTQVEPIAVPQLRNLYERTGFNATQPSSRAGFGYSHNGSVDSIERFVALPMFALTDDQDVADLVAFLLCFSGSNLPEGSIINPFEGPGPASRDTHAAVGRSTTLLDAAAPSIEQTALVDAMLALADADAVGLVAHRREGPVVRGLTYLGADLWQADRSTETLDTAQLKASAAPGNEVTLTVVPKGSELRLGTDRDGDGHLDGDELDLVSDPASAASFPGVCVDPLPTPPSSFQAAADAAAGRVALTWTDPGDGSVFTIERSPFGAGAFEHQVLLPAHTTSFVDHGVDCGGAYDYRILAHTCRGSSAPALSSVTAAACDSLTANVASISVSAGGRQVLALRAPLAQAGDLYLLAGTLSGTTPGIDFGTALLPLNPDSYFVFTLTTANTPPLLNTIGTLDATARGLAAVELPVGSNPGLAGLVLDHAFLTLDAATLTPEFASNAVPLELVP